MKKLILAALLVLVMALPVMAGEVVKITSYTTTNICASGVVAGASTFASGPGSATACAVALDSRCPVVLVNTSASSGFLGSAGGSAFGAAGRIDIHETEFKCVTIGCPYGNHIE